MFSSFGALSSGTRSTIVRPYPSSPARFVGLLVSRPHRRDTEVHEDLGPHAVVPRVGSEAKLDVRLDGVQPPVLERVGLELVPQTDPTALVATDVHDHSFAGLIDSSHRFVQLHPAVAPDASQHIAGEAL